MKYSVLKIFCLVFAVHSILVLSMCGLTFLTLQGNLSDRGEASLGWMIFLAVDFPASILVMITSGASIVSVPECFMKNGIVFRDVIWPGIVFQVLGTINWFVIVCFWKQIQRLLDKRIA